MNNISFELYKIFYEVGKTKNITKASNNLFISQPAITQQIKKLESELDCALFYRTKYGVEFTKEGEELFKIVENSILSLENVPDSLSKIKNVSNNINFASSFGSARIILSPAIPKLIKKFPDVNIKLDILTNEQILDSILNNSADIGFINRNDLFRENISYIEWTQVERVFVASKEFIEKNKIKKITKENITKYPFIATGKKSATRILFDEFLLENNIYITPKLDIDSFEMALDLIVQGYGFALFNKPYAKEYLEKGKLIEIKSDIKFPTRTIYLAMNKNNENNKFIKDIIKIITWV